MMAARLKMLLLPVVIAGLLTAAAFTGNRLRSDRRIHAAAAASPAVAPPGAAFTTIFLGGFRGLITDLLWVRAAMLQEQGRYFELVQLADWITALEPHYPQVWALQAWNMAYNVSILMPDDASRWRWVQNGLYLLRDRALPATRHDPRVCLELGLLFQNKIGGRTDEYADYYKQRWVQQVMRSVAPDGLLANAAGTALQDEFKMDSGIMRQIEARYGTMDWRVPESHALYWAFTGLMMKPDRNTAILCQRMIYQSLAALFETGGLTVEPSAGILVLATSFNMLPGARQAFEEALPGDPTAAGGYAAFLRRAIQVFLFYQRPDDARPLFEMLQSRFPAADTGAGFEAFCKNSQDLFLPQVINIR